MKVTAITRSVLAYRRQARGMRAAGYEFLEGPWDLLHGARYTEKITDVAISTDGKGVWIKCTREPALPRRLILSVAEIVATPVPHQLSGRRPATAVP